jgi:hypothetical protein
MASRTHRPSFRASVALICLGGLAIFGMFTALLAWGQTTAGPAAATQTKTYNTVGSFGMDGYPALTLRPTAETPSFITDPLSQNRGVILLAYVEGAAADDEMLQSFEQVKAMYSDRASFFSFEAASSAELGDVLDQLGANQPPLLVVIRGDGSVYQLYTGWISEKVIEQVVSNAVSL